MGWAECTGCSLIAFGLPFALFVFTIVRDPLRIILFVGGCFMWLVALLFSSIIWFAIFKISGSDGLGVMAAGMVIAVAFQELLRFLYYLLLRKAETGLQKFTEQGMHIEGVHSLRNARHMMSYVCGLGFGVMAGCFTILDVLTAAVGPGTLGLKKEDEVSRDYSFFISSSFGAACLIILNTTWNIVFFDACRLRKYASIIMVILGHYAFVLLSMANHKGYRWVSLPISALLMIVMIIWATLVGGISRASIKSFATDGTCIRKKTDENAAQSQQAR